MSGGDLVRLQLRSHEEGLLDICGTSVLIMGHPRVEVKGNYQPAPAQAAPLGQIDCTGRELLCMSDSRDQLLQASVNGRAWLLSLGTHGDATAFVGQLDKPWTLELLDTVPKSGPHPGGGSVRWRC